jgi:hypothetical protein
MQLFRQKNAVSTTMNKLVAYKVIMAYPEIIFCGAATQRRSWPPHA